MKMDDKSESMFRLDIRKYFFTLIEANYWNRLPRAAVNPSSLEVFKAWLDGILTKLV